MTKNADLLARRNLAVARGVANMHNIYAERAENAEVWDVDGRRYIDFAGGIGVLNTGHRHPKVMAAVQRQMEQYTHTCFQVLPYEPYVALAERLNSLAPGDAPNKTLFLTTGAEAVENAVKIARAHTGRPAVIAFNGGYHGRTMMTLGLTGKVVPYKAGFGPFPGEIYHAPFPIEVHGISVDQSMAAVNNLFKADVEPARVAAIIIEPVQGEGGFYVAPPEFLKRLRALCDDHGILLIADEVQAGAGRTGRLFAMEHSGVVPDLTTLAKSIAGGFPISAVVGRADIMDSVGPGGLGGTYAGSPLGCAAALAVLDVFEEEGILERSLALGERLISRLRSMAQSYACIGDVRGLGSMVAMELFKTVDGKPVADADLTRQLVVKAAERGLILLSCGMYGNVIRILVPITGSNEVVDEGLDIIEGCLESLVQG
ncbi:MAG: 4-aminobutyrate--2-oxoglutarate transaminase [Chromatiaceae bacterium]|nr:4-aminobutyrate--2-oxoglutarate transaminase [Gammaproteobacteria bacterium]MCP5318653.1 4-aminobutyrate--2-oxoglutarate transaminase [Chromatiaceae bacterium]MCP5435290.1 4-aminobutyrate--2-oxoglutarate transaminase [Chromatiaceae bacterium]MCW5587029.1 4-aminobutyrate--2-oxoglutarate transaminase [Chromatiales bacterium]HPQ24347.1 4-aminobutyrate--2-oxoglutarate transaminase [Gammaproteobacteria bacterium]